jgi:hypothetical protein
MFDWLKTLTNIHNGVKNKLDNPHGLTKEDFIGMKNFSNQIPAFFSCIQPYKYDNNRMGRLIQNIVLAGWNLPIISQPSKNYEEFKIDLDEFQKLHLTGIVNQAHELKRKLI